MSEKEQQQFEQGQEDLTQLMEDLLDKLKLLEYEKQFLSQKNMKPLNKAYFAIQTNTSEQFNYFKGLVKWLFQMNEVQTADINKMEDPLTLAQNIINELKKIGIECNFPPVKLKPGYGEQIIYVLQSLVTRALTVKKFPYRKPKFEIQTQTTDEEPVQDTGSVSSGSEPEVASDEEPEDTVNEGFIQKDEDKMVIESKIDPKDWVLECERAASKLKIQIKHDPREWRGHFEQTKQNADSIRKVLPESRMKLDKLSDNLSELLERITKREDNINSNMNEQGTEYKRRNDEYKKIETQYKNLTNSIKEMGEQYRQITEKYEQVQTKLQEHGNTATDSSPVIKIKAALTKLRLDIKTMDLRVGVLSHTVLSQTFMEKKWHQEKENLNHNGLIFEENDELSD